MVGVEQNGVWGAVGERRLIRVKDGSTFVEEQLSVNEPHECSYRLVDVTGRQAMLISGVAGRWSFSETSDGTRVTWSWQVTPASPLAAALMPIVAALWRGYAGRALRVINAHLQNASG